MIIKFKILMGIAFIIVIFAGCADTGISNVKDKNLSKDNKQQSSEQSENVTEADDSEQILDEKIFDDNNPCQSLAIIQKNGVIFKQFVITMADREQFSLDIPESQDPNMFDEIILVDLDNDKHNEIVAICNQYYYYMSIYIINVEKKEFMQVPYIVDTIYEAGVPYEVLAYDKNKINIKSDEYDYNELIDLSYDDIIRLNFSENGLMSKDEFLSRYSIPKGEFIGYAGEAGIIEIVEYEGRQCLKIMQPIIGAWGKCDWLGNMATVLSWDKTGNYHIEYGEFIFLD